MRSAVAEIVVDTQDTIDLIGSVRATELSLGFHRAVHARALGVSQHELLALEYISRASELSPAQISERLGITSGGVTALVKRIEERGLVHRRPHPTDRRSTLLRLTPDGAELVERHLAVIDRPLNRALARLPEGELLALARFTEQLQAMVELEANTVAAARPIDPEDAPTPLM